MCIICDAQVENRRRTQRAAQQLVWEISVSVICIYLILLNTLDRRGKVPSDDAYALVWTIWTWFNRFKWASVAMSESVSWIIHVVTTKWNIFYVHLLLAPLGVSHSLPLCNRAIGRPKCVWKFSLVCESFRGLTIYLHHRHKPCQDALQHLHEMRLKMNRKCAKTIRQENIGCSTTMPRTTKNSRHRCSSETTASTEYRKFNRKRNSTNEKKPKLRPCYYWTLFSRP